MNIFSNTKDRRILVSNLFIFIGPSGSGKTTLMEALLNKHPTSMLTFVPSYTSRPKRKGEVEGFHYHYLDHNTFYKALQGGKFQLYTEINGAGYGMPLQSIYEALRSSQKVILILDDVGTEQAIRLGLNPITIFISPPSMEDLAHRLHNMGRNNVEERVANSMALMDKAFSFHHNVINYDFDKTLKEIEGRMGL